MAVKKEGKSSEQIQAEKYEMQSLISQLDVMTSKVPQSVMQGSYQTAVGWKVAAKKARSVIQQSRPLLKSLRTAYQQLSVY